MTPHTHWVIFIGCNARLTDLAAASAGSSSPPCPNAPPPATRRRNAAYLTTHLRRVTTPQTAAGAGHVYIQYTIRVPTGRDALRRTLAAQIQTRVYYPTPIHRLPPFQDIRNVLQPYPEQRHGGGVPLHPQWTGAVPFR